MNTRVLELIKNPKIITESDLNILETESEKMPYAQSIRALYLFGINLYRPEKYKENLSKTAAYTTDKKILYQFINSQKNSQKEETFTEKTTVETIENQNFNTEKTLDVIVEKTLENTKETEVLPVTVNKFDVEKIIIPESQESSEYISVDGEKNRLLYEGEENFLEEKSEEIDIEATKESGVITIKDDLEITENLIINDDNRSEETISEHLDVEEILEIPTEKISETKADTQVQDEDSSGNISFNGIEDYLPQVKFSVPKNHLEHLNSPKQEEKLTVENVISTSEYKEPVFENISEDDIEESKISFENTQPFVVSSPKEIEKTEIKAEEIQIKNPEILEPKEEIAKAPISTWKPMSFSANTPDALIGKEISPKENTIPILQEKIEIIKKPVEKLPEIIDVKPEITETERQIMNVSFFGNDVSKIEEKKEISAIPEKIEEKEIPDSNVGTFINTWQNWLKIDRPNQPNKVEEKTEEVEKVIAVKEKIIDQFIEKNPRISQLKDEVNFVVKEKKDDISHLMTETLAKLYVEQKLYSKAIKGYETLSEKHPHKKDYFLEKIEEIKEIRKS